MFYGIGNIGDSKKTDASRVNDANDPNEFCVEIMDWNRYLSSFPADTMISTLYTDEDGKQILRFEDFLIDANLGVDGILYEKDAQGNYYHSTDTTVDKTKTYYIDILENDDFSEDYTYGFRYIQKEWKKEDDVDYKAKNEAFQRPLRQKWIEFYRFVTRDLKTDQDVAQWKSEFSNWFILDSALYYYLYTLRYTMVDNRAKNTFWHWCKHYLTLEEALAKGIAVYDADKNLITDASNPSSRFYDKNGKEIKNINAAAAAINNGYRMEFWGYDNDTALGIDNAGKLEIPIGVEDGDVDFAGVPYFRAHDSLVFVRIAQYFVDELEDTWHNTEINPVGKVFDSTGFINEFDAWQNQFPEELWRLAYERQYKRTYVGGTGADWDNALPQSNKSDIVSTRFLTEMMNGRKKYQRRRFERDQEIFMSSKFKGEVNLNDTITLRGTGKPTGKVVPPNFTLNLVPFSKMYVNLYDATDNIYYHQKHEAGEAVSKGYDHENLDFIYVRGASQIQSLGDLSPMYLQTAELTSGAKLKTITLGNATNGYSNDSLKTLQIGAGNKLLEELDIRNLSNFDTTTLPVSNIPSLKRVYAQGSNISEAVFANNGLLEEAYLPETLTRLELRNLHYLNKIEIEPYDYDGETGLLNLLHLVAMDCPSMNNFVLDIINRAPDLNTLRVTNINWQLDDAAVLERLYGLIKTTDSPEVVLTGKVYVPTIKQKLLEDCKMVWSDLGIDYNTKIDQYPVVFKNANGDILETQYVDKGQSAIDPTKRAGNPLSPTIPSTVSHQFAFDNWKQEGSDVYFDFNTKVFSEIVLVAQYTESLREYTIKYVSKGEIMQQSVGKYGENVPYTGTTPTYTAEEEGYVYYLFNRWDKSGFIDGEKIVEAIFDKFEYTSTSFNNKSLKDLSLVEIYAMNKLGLTEEVIQKDAQEGDNTYKFVIGNDVNYNDITSELLIENQVYLPTSKSASFNGGNYIDTGIKLFDEDKDFVLAMDYEFSSGNELNAVLAQCYKTSSLNSSGFKLWYGDNNGNSGVKFTWEPDVDNVVDIEKREMIVIRHKKGSNQLEIYKSDFDNVREDKEQLVDKTILTAAQIPLSDATLVFGASNPEEGYYENKAKGNIYWAKIWYADLGEDVCKNLAMWTHESVSLEVCGLRQYYLADNPNKRCSFSMLGSHLLGRTVKWNNTNTNDGGWAKSDLNKMLNTKLYNAIPSQIKSLLKKVVVWSNDGIQSGTQQYTTVTSSECYIAIPSVVEVDSTKTSAPYNSEGSNFWYMSDNTSRKRAFDNGEYHGYWLRSPAPVHNATTYPNYIWRVDKNGATQPITNATGDSTEGTLGVLMVISL